MSLLDFFLYIFRGIQACSSIFFLLSRKHHHCLAEEHLPRQPQIPDQRMTVTAEILQKKFGWMNDHAACFGVNGDNITVINQPCDFYETFKVNMLLLACF